MSWDINAYIKGAKDVYSNHVTSEHARKLRKYIKIQYFSFCKQKWFTLKKHHKVFDEGFYRVKNPILRRFIRDTGELNYESNNL